MIAKVVFWCVFTTGLVLLVASFFTNSTLMYNWGVVIILATAGFAFWPHIVHYFNKKDDE